MDDSSASQPSTPQPEQTGCNAVSAAMLISIAFFGYWGYHSKLFPEGWGQVLGVVLGLVVAILVTPIVFLLLMVFTHGMIKLEDFFQGEDPQSQQQSQNK